MDIEQIYSFSANSFFCEHARIALEKKYAPITEETDKFNRQTVSYQLNKYKVIHRWLKYKEGFSDELVNSLLSEMKVQPYHTILDPFVGSGTTSLVCKFNNIHSIGFDILPMSEISINVKNHVLQYNTKILKEIYAKIEALESHSSISEKVNYIEITKGAYPPHTEQEIIFLTKWNNESIYSLPYKKLIKLCIINSLERISYTSKDGQYLRWDYRSIKAQEANKKREEKGKPILSLHDKGVLPSLKEILLIELSHVIEDIKVIQETYNENSIDCNLKFIQNSALLELPIMQSNSINGVITSPPYCNRYDYTRTYALELAYLGLNFEEVKHLRQTLLSCTVESKSKKNTLYSLYCSIDRENDYKQIISILFKNSAFCEINEALIKRNKNGDINNKGVLQMVQGYFFELAFIYAELYRVCAPGSFVCFVNDNVRYGGEVIPVDYMSTDIAEQLGFKAIKVYTLKQKKGNSSQQMKKFGRVPLRKSITIWQKV